MYFPSTAIITPSFPKRAKGSFKLAFQEQIDAIARKINLPTERYDDVIKSAHDRAFVVAGALQADLLADLRQIVEQAIKDGKTISWFRKEFTNIVAQRGWTGWTGEDSKAGRDWRTRVIYSTNLSTSYAAGRWTQLNDPDLLKIKPYWQYIHNDIVRFPRELHESWNGLVLHHTDPWWQVHYPPNGWGCRCYVIAVSAAKYKGHAAPDDGTRSVVDRYGQAHELPNGVDYGWDYAPGANADTSLRQFVQDKLIRYPATITRALTKDINRYITAEKKGSQFASDVLKDKSIRDTAWLGFVDSVQEIQALTGIDTTGYLLLLPADAVRHVDRSHRFDGKSQRPATEEDYDLLPTILNDGALSLASDSTTNLKRIIARIQVGNEWFRAVFEIRPGQKNRALVLVSLVIGR